MAYQTRTPGSQASLRESNRVRILEALHTHGGLTKVELAGATGLSAGTVHNIVKELADAGTLQTRESIRSGRRAIYVTLAHAIGLVVGIHFSHRHLRIALADVSGAVLAENEMPLAKDHRADNELRKCLLLVADMLATLDSDPDELLSVGIGIPAPVVLRTGLTVPTGMLKGWDHVPIADVLERGLQRPVFVANSSDLAALAESRLGALRGKAEGVYLDVNEGLGAGLIIGGRLHQGFAGSAGEFGHMVINEHGPVCRCGNRGCINAIASGQAILNELNSQYTNLKLNDLIVRAMAGDGTCIRAIAEAGNHLGVAVTNLGNLLGPERIVVGGELSRVGELLLGPLRREVERSLIVGGDSMPDVIQSQLGTRASLIGAVLHAIDRSSVLTAVSQM